MKTQSRSPKNHKPQAFALVVTLSLMVLLTIIAVSLLSLSTISLRGSSRDAANNLARANARMALILAIGELQKHTGADTRVTAPANIVDENFPQVLGVWRSWEGTDHETNGRPIAPQYGSKDLTESSGGRFINWLVSTAATSSSPSIDDAPNLVKTSQETGTVPLLAGGSLQSTDSRQIHLVPTKADDGGRFAWWVSGENQKAVLGQPYEPRNNDVAGLAEMGQSHTVSNPEVFGLPTLIADPEPHNASASPAKPGRKALSRNTMILIEDENAAEPQKKFHDLSSYSFGLLTNTATGGWRKDLTILTEKWDDIYRSYTGGRLPLFRLSPAAGDTTSVPKPIAPADNALATNAAAISAATPAQSNLYPWSNYSLILGVNNTPAPNTYQAASASWQSLVSYATSYKNFYFSGGYAQSPFVWDTISNQNSTLKAINIYKYKHTQRLYPQMARFQFIVYAKAVQTSAAGANPPRFRVDLLYAPVITLWNPYNIGLTYDIPADPSVEAIGFGWRRSLPGVMAVVNKSTYPIASDVPKNLFKMFNSGNFQFLDVGGNHGEINYENALPANVAKGYATGMQNGVMKVQILGGLDMRTFMANLPSGTLTFKPGEVKVFSPDGRSTVGFGATGLGLREGYDPGQVAGRQVNSVASNLTSSQALWFLMKTDKLTQPYKNRKPGLGFTLSFGRSTGPTYLGQPLHTGIQEELHNVTTVAPEAEGNIYWPSDEVDEVEYSVGELASGPWIPVFSMSMGPRMTLGTAPGTDENRPTKGVLQNNPLASMSLTDPVSGDPKAHPANGTFDITYHSLKIGSSLTPNLSDSKGFIATGYQSGDGLSRLLLNEIPQRPMASLVELQGWNPRGHNPYPPFQMNLIGNSDATPLIPMNQVVPPTLSPAGIDKNLMHDDAYCANHLLFDDWFLSSIAPEPETSKDIDTVYTEWLKGERELTNRSYRPISADSKVTDAVATKRVGEVITSNDGWLKVASRFEVEGMFNVNSTSVEAWTALLGHARSLGKIAMHGADDLVETDTSGKHPVTRGAVATDIEAGTGKGFGGQFELASEYTGFRTLNDDQIKDLAEKVVEQVRDRGPFLSLSEFVNRQLSSNKGPISKSDLALAGAIQSALNKLDQDPMEKLRDPKNSLSDKTMSTVDVKLTGVGYEYKEAAEGDSAYGAPGWIRQADILRPIAPIISVRDDTFTIRAYGDSLDQNGKVEAQAWCEAVIKRTRDFFDHSDAADSINPPANNMNTLFGRQYEIISFRWLNSDEV